MFIRVHRLEMQSLMLEFSTQLAPSNLLSGSSLPPSPAIPVNKYTVRIHVYTYPMCKGGRGMDRVIGVERASDRNICHKVPLQMNF
jgi:hypothetical protein